MVRLGMTPTEALRAATVVATGIAALRNVVFVMKGGSVYRRQ